MNAVAEASRVATGSGGGSKPLVRWADIAGLLVIFALGFGVRYWYNFSFPHLRDYAAGDAYEYLTNAGALLGLQHMPSAFWHQCWQVLTGSANQSTVEQVKQSLAPLNDLAISGAVFPFYLAASYALSGTSFSVTNWMPPVFAQCVISALIGVFVALTGRYAFNRRTGLLGGLFCALYPGFIVNSDRLYTETLAAFLLSVVCFITVIGFIKPRRDAVTLVSAFANGLAASCLQFTRSIMVVLTAALIPITLFQQGLRKGLPAVAAFLLAFAVVAVPWLAFQKLAFGSASLIVDRAGHYNLFTGNYTDTAGWLSFPYPNFGGMENKSLPRLAMESFVRSPKGWLRLMQDKPVRLLKLPWNDFRKPIGFISFHWQALFHQALLLLAAIGMVLGFVSGQYSAGGESIGIESAQILQRRRYACWVFLLSVLALQSVYLFFITIPRYNLTIMPIVLLYSAVGFNSFLHTFSLRNGRGIGACLGLSALLLYLIVRISPMPWLAGMAGGNSLALGVLVQAVSHLCAVGLLAGCIWAAISCLSAQKKGLPAASIDKAMSSAMLGFFLVLSLPVLVFPSEANGRLGEWKTELAPGSTITQKLVLPETFDAARQLYLLIDSNSASPLQSVCIKINGKVIDASYVPSIALCDDFTRFQNLPDAFVRDGEWIFSCLTGRVGISNADLRQWFVVPVPNSVLGTSKTIAVELTNLSSKEQPVVFGSYGNAKRWITIPAVSLYSWEKAFYGSENDDGLGDTRFNTSISGLSSVVENRDLSEELGVQSGRYNIHLLAAAPSSADGQGQAAGQIMQIFNRPLGPAVISAKLHEKLYSVHGALPSYSEHDWWLVRFRAKARQAGGQGEIGVKIKAVCASKEAGSDAPTCLTRKWGDVAPTKPDSRKPYISPWTGKAPLDQDWRQIDVAVPLVAGSFSAPLKEIDCLVETDGSKQKANSADAGMTQLKDVSLQIIRLPGWPLQPGYEVY